MALDSVYLGAAGSACPGWGFLGEGLAVCWCGLGAWLGDAGQPQERNEDSCLVPSGGQTLLMKTGQLLPLAFSQSSFLNIFIYLCIWLCWVLVATCGI